MSWFIAVAFAVAFGATAAQANAPSLPASPGEPRPAPGKEFACGTASKPCPLQGWMRATFASASTRGDVDALAKGFDFLAAKAPPGYSEWTRIAKEGAAFARKKDLENAKQTCQACHSKYKSKYREELRDRPL